jgi:hypothetical protein
MSEPTVKGSAWPRPSWPSRASRSHGPTPAAFTATNTSPAPGTGQGVSSSRRASMPPDLWTRMAFISCPRLGLLKAFNVLGVLWFQGVRPKRIFPLGCCPPTGCARPETSYLGARSRDALGRHQAFPVCLVRPLSRLVPAVRPTVAIRPERRFRTRAANPKFRPFAALQDRAYEWAQSARKRTSTGGVGRARARSRSAPARLRGGVRREDG